MLQTIRAKLVDGDYSNPIAVTPNCWVVHYGNKPNIKSYYRTDQTDSKGRVIFQYRAETPSQEELAAIYALGMGTPQPA